MGETNAHPPDRPAPASPRQLDLLFERLDHLPLRPGLPAALLDLPHDDTDAARRVVHLATIDPALAACLVRDAATQGGPTPTTLQDAADRLGPDALRLVALAAATAPSDPRTRDDVRRTADASLATALAADALARAGECPFDPAEAYLCGLLCDLGTLAMIELAPKTLARAADAARRTGTTPAGRQRELLGTDHVALGRRLAQHWGLGRSVEEVCWLHAQPAEALPESLASGRMVRLVALAAELAHQATGGPQAAPRDPARRTRLTGALDIDPAAVETVARDLPGRVAERLAAAPRDEERWNETQAARAWQAAAARLRETNERLRTSAGAQASHADALRRVSAFHEGFHSDATVAEVLARVATAFAGPAQPGGAILAYFLPAERDEILAVRRAGRGATASRTFPRRPGVCVDQPAGPNREAADVLSEIAAEPRELLAWADLSACEHQPLSCGGRWVGGVFLPAVDGADSSAPELADALGVVLALVGERTRAVALSEELARASAQLDETREALARERTLATVGEMAAGAAHELNNPLAVISGRAQLMRNRAPDENERKVWELITEQTQRISDIVTELMEFASPPRPSPAAVEPARLLIEARDRFLGGEDPQAASPSVDITTDGVTRSAWADASHMHWVLRELLANAARAGGEGVRIRLAAEAADERVVLTVADDGPGMDPQTLAEATTPFFSAQRAGRRRGLGLARARRIVEANGGRLWLTSRPGEGTTAHVELPSAR